MKLLVLSERLRQCSPSPVGVPSTFFIEVEAQYEEWNLIFVLKNSHPVGTLYAFRHGRVSLMQDAGVNEKIIQLEAGHTNLRMTRRYTHFSHQSRRATAEKLAI